MTRPRSAPPGRPRLAGGGVRPRGALPAACLLLAIALAPSSVRAADDPELQWWTVETDHFRIHYERDIEPLALRLARVGEAVHGRLRQAGGYEPRARTEIVLSDYTDQANGLATAVPYNAIRLYVTAPSDLSPLSDYDDWQLDLLTHEHTHVLHLDNISGVPAVINALLGKTLAPNQLQPRWVVEGMAVVAESEHTSAGRIRSSLYDMYLRADVLEDRIAGLDEISSSPRRWPQGTLWYLYGSRFLDWIGSVYGPDTMRAVAADYGATLLPWGINRAIRRTTGRTYPELYEGFKSELRRRHGRQMRDVLRRGLREGVRLTFHGRNVYYPQFVPPAGRRAGPRAQDGPATAAGYALAYFRDDLHERSGIYELDLRPDGRPSGAAELLVARTSTASPLSFAPDGGMLFASEVPWRNVYQRTDLFLLAPGERAPSGAEPGRRRLTTGLRATAPSLSPDGRTVAFTVNARGTTSLGLARLGPDGPIEGRRTLVAGARFDQVYTPVFSPDGSRIALSTWSAGGFRDLRIVEVPSGRSVALMRDRALDTGPCWSPDGRTLYFASDRTGIFNIYAYSLADGTLRQVTNVRTGAFMPAVSPDQRWLVYVGYTGAGHDLYAMPLDPARFLAAPAARQERPDAPAEPPPVRWRRQRYDPLPTLRPYRYSFEYAPGSFGTNALTVRADGADVVGHHSMSAAVVADPGAPLPQLSLDYGYGRLPLDLSLQVSNRVAPRTDFRISDRTPQYVERSYGIRSGLSYTDNQEFGYQRGGVSYGASIVDRSLPVGTAIDPYAGLTSEPQRGLMAIVHLGYALSNVEGSFETAGAARGFSLGLSLDLADSATGSSESVYAASYTAALYLPMPWPGHQTLALRSRGGLSAGSYSRRGIFYVGGYDLERTSLLDTITSGILSGAFVLRGYPPNAYAGSTMMLQNAEYRIPLVAPDLGISTLPLYLRRVSGNLFFDHGGAFDRLDFEATEFLARGALLDSPQLHSAAGAELWLEATLAYYLDVQFRLGYARGFSVAALPGGQGYFVAAGAY